MWDWNLELAADPQLEDHPVAPTVYGMAAMTAWLRGKLDRADELADMGLDLAGGSQWACNDAKSLAALSCGDLDVATEQALLAARTAPRPIQSLGVAALAPPMPGTSKPRGR